MLMQVASVFCVSVVVAGQATAGESAAERQNESPQVSAVRGMKEVLQKSQFTDFYRDHCHPNLRKQLSCEEFVQAMNSSKGKAIVALFDNVVKAIDDNAGKDVLVAQPQDEEGRYEFILVAVRKNSSSRPRAGREWHIELGLDQGKWKLVDTD